MRRVHIGPRRALVVLDPERIRTEERVPLLLAVLVDLDLDLLSDLLPERLRPGEYLALELVRSFPLRVLDEDRRADEVLLRRDPFFERVAVPPEEVALSVLDLRSTGADGEDDLFAVSVVDENQLKDLGIQLKKKTD